MSVLFVQTQGWLHATWALVPRMVAAPLGLMCTESQVLPGARAWRSWGAGLQAGMANIVISLTLFCYTKHLLLVGTRWPEQWLSA